MIQKVRTEKKALKKKMDKLFLQYVLRDFRQEGSASV